MRGRTASSKFPYYDHIVQIAAKKFILLSLVYWDTEEKLKQFLWKCKLRKCNLKGYGKLNDNVFQY